MLSNIRAPLQLKPAKKYLKQTCREKICLSYGDDDGEIEEGSYPIYEQFY